MNEFLGRDRELAVLEDLHESGRPELYVLYGRRRVGKTELLQRFCSGRRAVYFQAAQVRDKDNLSAFKDAVKDGLADPLVDAVEFPDWPAALSFASQRAGDERLVVVLDEFPYLCEANKGLPSLLQRFWDSAGKQSNLMLVLCGSQVSFMEREVLAERSPLFGRRTAQRRLEPLRPKDALAFFEGWDLGARLEALGILGGMPAYLRRFATGTESKPRDVRANVLREILRPEGYLFDEVQFLLRTEMSAPATYNSILHAIARGSERVGDVALSVGIDSTTANRYLSVLRELGLVERAVPLTDPDPLRSRRGVYRIADPFLTFHFRHVQPHLSLIQADRGERVFDEQVAPDLPNLRADAVLELVLDHLRREAAEVLGSEVIEVGRHSGACVRALARLSDGSLVAAIVREAEDTAADTLEEELAALRALEQGELARLRYTLTDRCDAPLRVERPKR